MGCGIFLYFGVGEWLVIVFVGVFVLWLCGGGMDRDLVGCDVFGDVFFGC